MVPSVDSEAATVAPEVSDLWPRVLISPVLGIVLPNVAGVIDNSRHSAGALAASYAYFACVAFVIWQGNRWFYLRLQRRDDWLRRPLRRVTLLLGAIALYTIPVCTVLLLMWRAATHDPGSRAFAIPTAVLATLTVVIAITHVYETVFLLRDWESDRLRSALTESARLEAELEALGREVDPHFLFNNLNALVHLVEQRSDAAVPFVNALSATYRYVLESRGRRLVTASAEIEALRQHRILAAIRYGDAVRMEIRVDSARADALHLPPVSLAELFQNALKHNDPRPDAPLTITVGVDGALLVFANDLRKRGGGGASTGTGLRNLAERVRLATGGEITWGEEDGRFVVRLPLVGGSDHARPTDLE